LAFSISGINAIPLLSESSALVALSALVAIGVTGATGIQVDEVVEGIVRGATRGDRLDLPFVENKLKTILLDIFRECGGGSASENSFSVIVNKLFNSIPSELASMCRADQEVVTTNGISLVQLGTIAEWAFEEKDL
jgi:hypothetical protein